MVLKSPFLFRGPDPTRVYAMDFYRWVYSENDVDPTVIARLRLNNSFGLRRCLGVILFPLVGFLAGGIASIWIMDRGILAGFILGGLFAGGMAFVINYSEHRAFVTWPRDVIIIHNDRLCVMNDGHTSIHADEHTFFRFTEFAHGIGWSGSPSNTTYSELDIVFEENDEPRVVKLIAYQHTWCLKHAKKFSEQTGIQLQRNRAKIPS